MKKLVYGICLCSISFVTLGCDGGNKTITPDANFYEERMGAQESGTAPVSGPQESDVKATGPSKEAP